LVQVLSAGSYGFNEPRAIAFDGSHIWVADYGNNSVTELDASTGTLVQVLSRGYGFEPAAMAVDGPHIWVADYGASVTELDASTGTLVQVLSAGSYGFNEPRAIAFDGSHIWVANYQGGSVTDVPAG
jgi:DNA-binding beta-propeller fold protein YncE